MRHCRYNRFIVYFALIALVFCFALPEARAQLPFYSDFENVTSGNQQGWSVDNGIWAIGTPTNTNGPDAAYAGNQCAATVLAANYPGAVPASHLISPPINLPSVGSGQQIVLTFRQWFAWWIAQNGFQSSGYGDVEVRTWTASNTWSNWTTSVNNPSSGNTAYTGSSGGWSLASVDLSAYQNQQIEIGFLHYGGSGGAPGWYIDDVGVSLVSGIQNLPYAQGFESLSGIDGPGTNSWLGWSADNGVWQAGTPTNPNGPRAAFDGQSSATTVLAANYPGGVSISRLVSPIISLPAVASGQQIVMTFWQWFGWWIAQNGFQSSGYGEIQVSQLNNGSWTPWATVNNPNSGNGAYSGSSGGWSLASVDLSAYASSLVQISFLHSPGSGGDPGWCVDDVTVALQAIPYLPINQNVGFENFISSNWFGWYADNGLWDVGAPTNPNGPTSAYDGTQCAGTVLAGNYPGGQASRLISPPMALPTVATGQHITLTFFQWFKWWAAQNGFQSSGYGVVEISTWTNGAWTLWAPVSNQFTGSSGGIWDQASIDITAYEGQLAQLAFLHYGGSGGDPGWYIDDVTINTPQTNNPVPTLATVAPNSAPVGAGNTTITLTGTNFLSTSTAQWNGVPLSTVGTPTSTTFKAAIPAMDLTTAGTFNITVFNPTPGGGTSNSVPFKVVVPSITVMFTSPATGAAVKGAVAITGTITDTLAALGTWTLTLSGIQLGSGTGRQPSFAWNTALWADGAHALVLTEKDAAGNTGSATLTVTVNNGGVTSVTITSPAAGACVKGTVTIKGKITDIAPGTWTLTDNGAQIGTGAGLAPSVAWNTATVADGANKLVLTETDAAGHTASSPATTVTVNNTGITSLKITSPSAGAVVDGKVTITGTIADAAPGTWTLECDSAQLASGNGNSASGSWVTTLWADGRHTLELAETDLAGNKASTTLSVTVNNKGVTAIAITSPANGAVVKGTLTVKGAITDSTPGSWTLTDNGTQIGAGTGLAPSVAWNTKTVADGSHTLVLKETDTAGHTGSASTTVTVNNTGVTGVVITAPANGAVVKGTVSVTGTITDATPGTWTLTCNGVQLGAGTGTSASVNWDTTQWVNGTHKLVLTETDAAGNVGSATINVTVSN